MPGILAGGILETVHLLWGQIFPLPKIGVSWPARRNCPIYDGGGVARRPRFSHSKCPYGKKTVQHFAESCQRSKSPRRQGAGAALSSPNSAPGALVGRCWYTPEAS